MEDYRREEVMILWIYIAELCVAIPLVIYGVAVLIEYQRKVIRRRK